jgi:hypothetical protein
MKRPILFPHTAIIAVAAILFSCAGEQAVTGNTGEQAMIQPEMNVVVKPGTTFSIGDTITLMSKLGREDVAGIEGILTNQLMSHGFHVISGSTARTVYKYVQASPRADSTVHETNTELYRVIEVNSVYILEFSGKVYLDFLRLPRHYDFNSFSVTITDITTGEIVVSGNFTGNKPVAEVCTEFVDQMLAKLQ